MSKQKDAKTMEYDKKYDKLYKKLSRKFNKLPIIVDESKIRQPQNGFLRFLRICIDCVCVLLFILFSSFVLSTTYSRINSLIPTYMGYSMCSIGSSSMEASGFYTGDHVMVRSVDTKTLKEGDIIAFYANNSDYNSTSISSFVKIDNSSANIKYHATVSQLFGGQNADMMSVAKQGNPIYFHHIVDVFEDSDGVRWFRTKGSSNAMADQTIILNSDGSRSFLTCGYVSEKMVVGAYDGSGFCGALSNVYNVLLSSTTLSITLVLLPVIVLAVIIIIGSVNDARLAVVECQVVAGKRKLTDHVCKKHDIGYNLTTGDKYKVIAKTNPDEIPSIIPLMWRDGKRSDAIRKYYLRKKLYLRVVKEREELDEKCKQMLADNASPRQIVDYYESERKRIARLEKRIKKRVKYISRKNRKSNNSTTKQSTIITK